MIELIVRTTDGAFESKMVVRPELSAEQANTIAAQWMRMLLEALELHRVSREASDAPGDRVVPGTDSGE